MAIRKSSGGVDRDALHSESAVAAFLDADYAKAIELTQLAAPSADLYLLRVRALYRSERYEDALAALEEPFDGSADQRLLAEALRGAILCEFGDDLQEARAILDRVVLDAVAASPEARSEIAYYAALSAWQAGDLRHADELVAAAPFVEGVPAAKHAQLSGWIEVRRERYHAAVEHFLRSLDYLKNSEEAGNGQDLRFRAKGVHALANIASESIDLDLWKQIEQTCDDTRWTSGVAYEHFWTVTCRRFIALLQGDLEEAWMRSREAVSVAPNDAMRAIGETNAAAIARLVGDEFAARRQFNAAWQLIECNLAEWKHANVEERIALTNFAIEAADVMKAEALKCVKLYDSADKKQDRKLALSGSRRVTAFEQMAAGRIYEIMGKKDDAVRHYERSMRIWTALDFRMRASLVARSLHRLTGDDEYLNAVDVALHRAPNAWFRDESAWPPVRLPELEQLTKAERNVLRELLGGKSSRDIAQALSRSPFTINNHTKRLFEVFGVRSRAALIARAAERGLSPDQVA